MCFSPIASLATGFILIPTGTYCIIKSIKNEKRFILFASIPVIFGIHQLIEGAIWHYLQSGNVLMAQHLAPLFLFIAFVVWPFFVPLSVFSIETHSKKKRIAKIFSVTGLILGISLFTAFFMQLIPNTPMISNHAISYTSYSYNPGILLFISIYASLVLLTLLISSEKIAYQLGLLSLISMLITVFWYLYAFTSVWCFFSAIISLYIVYAIHKHSIAKVNTNI